MDDDPLNGILDASAPRARALEKSVVRTMMAEAEAEASARPARSRRRAKVGLAAAASLALVIGGGGVAIASGLVTWPSNLENPDAAFEFDVPSGRACEFRLIVTPRESTAADSSADEVLADDVQGEVVRWLRSGAVRSALDLDAARSEVEQIYAEQGAVGMTVAIGAHGWLEDTAVAEGVPDADDAEAFAVDRATRMALREHLASAGYPESSWDFSTDGGVKCAAE